MEFDDRALNRRVGERIQERRQRSSMTQTQLAEIAGVLRTTIANIEGGRQRIPLHILYKVASSLSIEVCDILPTIAEFGALGSVSIEVDGQAMRIPPKAAAFVRRVRGEEGTDAKS